MISELPPLRIGKLTKKFILVSAFFFFLSSFSFSWEVEGVGGTFFFPDILSTKRILVPQSSNSLVLLQGHMSKKQNIMVKSEPRLYHMLWFWIMVLSLTNSTTEEFLVIFPILILSLFKLGKIMHLFQNVCLVYNEVSKVFCYCYWQTFYYYIIMSRLIKVSFNYVLIVVIREKKINQIPW